MPVRSQNKIQVQWVSMAVSDESTITQKQIVDSVPLLIIAILLVALGYVGARYYQSLMVTQYDSINLATESVVSTPTEAGVTAGATVTRSSTPPTASTPASALASPKTEPKTSSQPNTSPAAPPQTPTDTAQTASQAASSPASTPPATAQPIICLLGVCLP